MNTAPIINAIIQETWTSAQLPDEIADVGILNGERGTLAYARHRRYEGRTGYSLVDESIIGQPYQHPTLVGHTKTFLTAADTAIEQAICCSWFDSSYP